MPHAPLGIPPGEAQMCWSGGPQAGGNAPLHPHLPNTCTTSPSWPETPTAGVRCGGLTPGRAAGSFLQAEHRGEGEEEMLGVLQHFSLPTRRGGFPCNSCWSDAAAESVCRMMKCRGAVMRFQIKPAFPLACLVWINPNCWQGKTTGKEKRP